MNCGYSDHQARFVSIRHRGDWVKARISRMCDCYVEWSVQDTCSRFCQLSCNTNPLPSARQHSSYGDCLEVKREYYQNSSVLDCVTQNVHNPQHTYVSSSYRPNRLGLSHWDPYAVRRGDCLELYYCNMVECLWWDSSLISMTNWFPSVL